MALLDVQKAFDSVNHNILCKKLDAMGIESKWFESYLGDRSQIVSVNGSNSEKCQVPCGVPQGSLLGPLLFLIYSNDMEISVNCKLLLYADDSVLMVSDRDPEVIANKLGTEMQNCFNWMVDNRLSMHAGKTELILFGTPKRLNKVKNFEVNFQGHAIKGQKSVKYLGCYLDNDLTGQSMVDNIVKKASARISFLYRHKNYLDQNLRKLLGNALVQCHLDYCLSSWYTGINKGLKSKLGVTHNRLVKFILNLDPRHHIDQKLLDKIGFLKMDDRASQLMLNHMFGIFNLTAPNYLTKFFRTVSSVHNYNTRFSVNNFAPSQVSGPTHTTFYYNATNLWNLLPQEIKCSNNKGSFKAKLKKYLAQEARSKELRIFTT